MNRKQTVFVNEYLQCWNVTEAAKRAGYSERSAYSTGHRMLKNAEIAEAITARVAEKSMSADEVLLRLADQGRGSMEDFLQFEEVKFDPPRIDEAGVEHEREIVCVGINLEKAHAAGKLHLLKSVTKTGRGFKVELYDAQAALALLGRTHGLFVDRQEISGQLEMPIQIIEVVSSDSEH